ncbi:MAG: hypothetical protein ACOX7P_09610 [Oscillospiraceae bacterium]|jgi:hypothetical protein
MMGCYCIKNICTKVGFVLSLLFGIVIGTLFYFGCIGVSFLIKIALFIALFGGFFALVAAILSCHCASIGKCLKLVRKNLLLGVVGAIITAVVAFSILLIPFCIKTAVLVGFIALFLGLILSALVCFIICLLE